MANRTFLISADSPTKPKEGERFEIICAASYMIPLFWHMLFDRTSIVRASDTIEGGETVDSYPCYSSKVSEAVARALNRWPLVEKVIGPKYIELFKTWLNHVESKSRGFLHCETYEFGQMFELTSTFERHLDLCENALSDSNPVAESEAWQELLGQANVGWDGTQVNPAGTFSFAGYAWESLVPWET